MILIDLLWNKLNIFFVLFIYFYSNIYFTLDKIGNPKLWDRFMFHFMWGIFFGTFIKLYEVIKQKLENKK